MAHATVAEAIERIAAKQAAIGNFNAEVVEALLRLARELREK